jgi:hypothetical protein
MKGDYHDTITYSLLLPRQRNLLNHLSFFEISLPESAAPLSAIRLFLTCGSDFKVEKKDNQN